MANLVVGHVSPLSYAGFRDDIFGRLDAELDRVLGDFLTPKSLQRVKGDHYPKADVFRAKDSLDLHFYLAVPLTLPDDLEVALEDNGKTLTVSGKMSDPCGEETTFFVRELRRSSFTRSWTLGKEISEKDLSIDLQAGMLRIMIKNYFEEEKPKRKLLKIGK